MSKNPVINAVSASVYIILVVSIINFISQFMRHKPNTVFAPIVFLSLFTLSAAVMAYLFLYQPFLLFMDGKKKTAIDLFIKTVGVFAAITAILLILVVSGVLH